MTSVIGLALPGISFGQAKTETGTGGGVNENATSTRAQSTTTDTDTDTATSTKTKKKATVRESRKNRSQATGTQPANTQSATIETTAGAKANFPTTREPGHRKTMNGLGKRDSLQDTDTGSNMNPGTGH